MSHPTLLSNTLSPMFVPGLGCCTPPPQRCHGGEAARAPILRLKQGGHHIPLLQA